MQYIYCIQSEKNKKTYVGRTTKEPFERLKEHNQGSNVWSRNNRPFELLYYEKYICKDDAIAREKFYKMGFGKKIKKLIIETLTNGD